MKICMLNAAHGPYDKRVYYRQALSLKKAGYQVVIIAPGGVNEESRDGITIRSFTAKRRTLSGLKSSFARLVSLFFLFRLGWKERADIYQCNEPDTWLVGLLIKLLRRKAVVFDVHEHYPSTVSEGLLRPLRPMVERALTKTMRLAARFADHIITVTASVEEELFADLKTPRTLVMNTPPLSYCEHSEAAPGLQEDFIVIHVGTLNRSRGAELLLAGFSRAAGQDERIRLLLLGGFVKKGQADKAYTDECKRCLRSQGLLERVEIMDWVPFEEVPTYLHRSSVGIVVLSGRKNYRLSLPMKLFDYMSAGLPVIAPRFPEIERIVEETKCGLLIDPAKPEEIAEAILYLKNHSDEAQEMGRNGRRAVEEKYNWEDEAEKLLGVYEGLEER